MKKQGGDLYGQGLKFNVVRSILFSLVVLWAKVAGRVK